MSFSSGKRGMTTLGFDGKHFVLENALNDGITSTYTQTFWDPVMFDGTKFAPTGFYTIFLTYGADQTVTLDVFRLGKELARGFAWYESKLDAGWPVIYSKTKGDEKKASRDMPGIASYLFHPHEDQFTIFGFNYTSGSGVLISRFDTYNRPPSRNQMLGMFETEAYNSLLAKNTVLIIDSDLNDDAVAPAIDRPQQLLPCNTGRFLNRSGAINPVQTPCKSVPAIQRPSAPGNVAVAPTNGGATIRWNAATQGSSPIAAYFVTLYKNNLEYQKKLFMLGSH